MFNIYLKTLKKDYRTLLKTILVFLVLYVVLYFFLYLGIYFTLSSLEQNLTDYFGTASSSVIHNCFVSYFGGTDYAAFSSYEFEILKDFRNWFNFFPQLKDSLSAEFSNYNTEVSRDITNSSYTILIFAVIIAFLLLVALIISFFRSSYTIRSNEIKTEEFFLNKRGRESIIISIVLIAAVIAFYFIPAVGVWSFLIAFVLYPLLDLIYSYKIFGKFQEKFTQIFSYKSLLTYEAIALIHLLLLGMLYCLIYFTADSHIYSVLIVLPFSVFLFSLQSAISDIYAYMIVQKNKEDIMQRSRRKANTMMVINKTTREKLRFLKHNFHFKEEELKEIRKMYDGEFFNPEDDGVKKLYQISAELCADFNSTYQIADLKGLKLLKRQIHSLFVLRKLFCGTFMLADVRPGLDMVIGLVDAPFLTFFNNEVTFSPYSSVSFGTDVDVAPQVYFGDREPERKGNLTRLSHINIESYSWVGIHAEIKGEVTVGASSVIGAGATVVNDVPMLSVAIGNPAKVHKTLDLAKDDSEKIKGKYIFTKEERRTLYRGIRKVHYLSHSHFRKVMKGKYFNVTNLNAMALYSYTHHRCSQLDDINLTAEERKKIIDELFPVHGKNFKVGHHLFLDMIGTTVIGDNVTIGDNVSLGGNIRIGNDVIIGSHCSLFASGHPLKPKQRGFRFSFRHGFYQVSQHDPIIIEDKTSIGNDVVLTPKTTAQGNIPASCIYSHGHIIK